MALSRDHGKDMLKQKWETQINGLEEKLKDLDKLDDYQKRLTELRNRVLRYYNPASDYQPINKSILAIQQEIAQFQLARAKEEEQRRKEETERRIADAKKLSQFPEIPDTNRLSDFFSAIFCCCRKTAKTENTEEHKRLVN